MATGMGADNAAGRVDEAGNIVRAVATTIFAGMVASFLHIGVRHVSPYLPTFQIVFLRALFTIAFTLPFLYWAGLVSWRTNNLKLQLVRGVINVISMSTWYYSLANLPLADAGALGFTTSIFVTIGAALYFGEPVGLRRWSAVAIGLIGATIVLKPTSGVVSWTAIIAVLSSIFWAISLLFAKELGKYDSTLTISFYQPLLVAPVAGLASIPVWTEPPLFAWAILAAMGLFAAVSNYAFIKSLRMADVSITMSADYVRLIWMAMWGYFMFAEVPDAATWIGALLIMGSTLFITVREQQLAKARGRQ